MKDVFSRFRRRVKEMLRKKTCADVLVLGFTKHEGFGKSNHKLRPCTLRAPLGCRGEMRYGSFRLLACMIPAILEHSQISPASSAEFRRVPPNPAEFRRVPPRSAEIHRDPPNTAEFCRLSWLRVRPSSLKFPKTYGNLANSDEL